MRAVNLLPQQAYASNRWWVVDTGSPGATKQILVAAGAAATLAAALLGGSTFHERGVAADRRADLAAVEQKVAAADAELAAARAAQAAADARLSAVKAVASQRVAWDGILNDLSRVLPSDVWLQTLTASSPTAAPAAAAAAAAAATATAGAANSFSLTGLTSSQRGVALVLDRLELLPWLSDVTLQSSTRGDGGATGSGVQFTIGATLRSTGGQP